MKKGQPFLDVKADSMDAPVFSEAFLYETIGKGDARFVLGVAEEYDHIISAVGPRAVTAILSVSPRLVQRLELHNKIVEWLEDARTADDLYREEKLPSEVVLDSDSADAVWQVCHREYKRHWEPEVTLDRNVLRAYNTLTESLGSWAIDQRQKERDRLPEKLARRDEIRAERAKEKEQLEQASVHGT